MTVVQEKVQVQKNTVSTVKLGLTEEDKYIFLHQSEDHQWRDAGLIGSVNYLVKAKSVLMASVGTKILLGTVK